MNKYLRLSIIAASISLLISFYLFMKIRLEIAALFDNPSDLILEKIEKTSELSSAISAIVGLIIGSIAIIAVIESEKSETKAVEALKVDLISLINILQMIKSRCSFYSNLNKINLDLDIFQKEREHIQTFIGSSSGYALSLWMEQDAESENFDINYALSDLVNCLTLKVHSNALPLFIKISSQCYKIIDKLTKIDNKDFKDICKNIRNITKGLEHLSQLNATTFSDQLKNMIDQDENISKKIIEPKFVRPSQSFVKMISENARMKLGGEFEGVLSGILKEAKGSNEKDLWYFYEIVRLLNLDKKSGFSLDKGSFLLARASNFAFIPTGNGCIKMYPIQFSVSNFSFASNQHLGEISSLLNLLVYRNSIWSTNLEHKIQRNLTHINKNPKTILLIKHDDEYIGFTHCLPVNKNVWENYLKGKIADNDFSASDIVSDENYFGVIIFSIGYLGEFSNNTKLLMVYQALIYHISIFLSNKTELNVLIQNSDPYLVKAMDELELNQQENLSMDGYQIYTAKIINEVSSQLQID